jgi:hypothetical protein
VGNQSLTDSCGAEVVGPMNQVQVRPLAERRTAAMERLRSNSTLWLATASDGRGPHLIPLAYWWDGVRLTTATIATVADIADIPEVATRYAQASGNDPQAVPGFVYIQLVPERIQLWKGVAEFAGRTVMRAGVWLDDPAD